MLFTKNQDKIFYSFFFADSIYSSNFAQVCREILGHRARPFPERSPLAQKAPYWQWKIQGSLCLTPHRNSIQLELLLHTLLGIWNDENDCLISRKSFR